MLIGIILGIMSYCSITSQARESYGTAADTSRCEIDTTTHILPGVEVNQSRRNAFSRNRDGSISLKGSDVKGMTRFLGEADYINQLKLLATVNTTSDYSSGINVDGSDITQAQYLIDGAPVIYPYRFGGIFSVFNPAFFSAMKFYRRGYAALPPRLGPAADFITTPSFDKGTRGEANVGLISSSLTVRQGVGDRFDISAGARISYIDQLYSSLMKSSRNELAFSFRDLNLSAAYRISQSDIVKAGGFASSDHIGYYDSNYALDTRIKWSNSLVYLSYHHSGSTEISAGSFHSAFKNTLSLEMPLMRLNGPSTFSTTGAHFRISRHTPDRLFTDWNAGVRLSFDRTSPQYAELLVNNNTGADRRASTKRSARLFTPVIFGETRLSIIPRKLSLKLETSAGYYLTRHYHSLLFSPHLELAYKSGRSEYTLSGGYQVQPVHQVGFSELGLASNFWIGACRQAPVQRAVPIVLSYGVWLPFCDLYMLFDIFHKQLWDQPEYEGQVLEVIDTNYNPYTHLVISDGYNFGVAVSLSRRYGRLTGDIAYSYTDGKRHLRNTPNIDWHPVNGTGSTFKANATYDISHHWNVSAAFRFADGRRYTPVKSIYLIADNIAMVYGKRNSERLPKYMRLDLSATYSFESRLGSRHLSQMVNISLLNATGHRNTEMQYFVLNPDRGNYHLKRLYSLYRFIPSLSYTVSFR